MNEPKPFASLSSGLLARKGAAKPAMRPQGFGPMSGIEDLGWNDLGFGPAVPPTDFEEEPREHVPSSIAALTPAPKPHEHGADAPANRTAEDEDEEPASPVAEQQRAIEESFHDDLPAMNDEDFVVPAPAPAPVPASTPASVVALPRRPRQAPGLKAKAAFTLRLDPDRHLKLRLACAVTHRSAQQIVSEALDEFLKSLPELDALAQQLPAQAGKRN